jgi:fructose-1,6-bisphosphatase I
MRAYETLGARLEKTVRDKQEMAPACRIVAKLADVSCEISVIASLGALAGWPSEMAVPGADVFPHRELELRIHDMIMETLRDAPVASVLTEELGEWTPLDTSHSLSVAFEPLDGSSHFDANLSVGTIFSILPPDSGGDMIYRGGGQVAAGFFLYGPQTTLVLTLGEGVDVYTLDRRDQTWRLTRARAMVPTGTPEYAINASNGHWEEFVRAFMEDYPNQVAQPRADNGKMRWVGALVAEAYRVLVRGGVYLYPSDQHAAHRGGRSRLIYEAHPIAFIMEQAGGRASTGRARIIDLSASHPQERVPLIFGCADQVAFIERLLAAPALRQEVSPLFGRRGLFRN